MAVEPAAIQVSTLCKTTYNVLRIRLQPQCTPVYPCIPLNTPLYLSKPLHTTISPCKPLNTSVDPSHHCKPGTHVYPCIPLNTLESSGAHFMKLDMAQNFLQSSTTLRFRHQSCPTFYEDTLPSNSKCYRNCVLLLWLLY